MIDLKGFVGYVRKKIEKTAPKKVLIMLCFLLPVVSSRAQDIQFSQFYANVLYVNPAFAGSSHCLRGTVHQRLQWPALDAKYITTNLSADCFLKKSGSGLGLIFLKDWQGASHISSTEFDLQYAQELNLTSKVSVRAGAQVGYVSRYINYSKLTFPDQFNDNGATGAATQEPFGTDKVKYLDYSLGGMVYSDNFWLGLSSHHLTQPQQSWYDQDSRLPVKMTLISGYKIIFEKKRTVGMEEVGRDVFITPTLHYKFQGKSDQVDLGLYGLYDHLLAGFWYRGIPLLKHYRWGLQNNESIVLLLGYRINGLSIGYSFDFTVSKLAVAGTGGSHELNLTYIYCIPPKRKKRHRPLPCPHFYR